jgi:ABC-2 type transport system permease protein
LWGFISKFFTLNSEYYNNTIGVILTAAILYDFLFRASISFNMMFLEEIWSRNFTNLFIAPIKISEIIASLTITAILRTLIGLVPAVIIAVPLFGVSILKLGLPLIYLLLSLYLFGISLGLLVTAGLLRYGPSFENIAWASLFFLAPLGCIYYPIEILPEVLQLIAKGLPLVHIFEEMRNILINNVVSYSNIFKSTLISIIYFSFGVIVFYLSYFGAKKRGTLINMGE